ncbi:hypothetical protein BDA96_10G345600 [Sorghum bicolor]|uniref:Uncharacterized protein n=1 Tax=Sorghum bicolor TaxID=4558 RepID=A0A921Q6Y5_SORBI|nr:hypothetical protein BDA96_10G345600 [Sorghum bicolor]
MRSKRAEAHGCASTIRSVAAAVKLSCFTFGLLEVLHSFCEPNVRQPTCCVAQHIINSRAQHHLRFQQIERRARRPPSIDECDDGFCHIAGDDGNEERVGGGCCRARTLKRKTPSSSSEPSTSSDGGSHILKLKKAAFAADALWREMKGRPRRDGAVAQGHGGGRQGGGDPAAQQAKKEGATCMSAEMLSSRPASFRRQYAMRKYIDGKWGDSLQQGALVDQYDLLGYAEDEDELTDDDVVKMGSLAIR